MILRSDEISILSSCVIQVILSSPKPAEPTVYPQKREGDVKRTAVVFEDDVKLRTAPQPPKPKANPNRKSVYIDRAKLQQLDAQRNDFLAAQEKEQKELEKKLEVLKNQPESPPVPVHIEEDALVQTNSVSDWGDIFSEIGESWKIDYQDLEFEELISEGSAGEVFSLRTLHIFCLFDFICDLSKVFLGYYYMPVAIKKLHDFIDKKAIKREYSLLAQVRHPNIVQVSIIS
jgi:hypothetical protein